MPTRRQFLAASAASTAIVGLDALPATPATPATAARVHRVGGRPGHAPNVVLIAADDLGYGELGAYGQRLIRTPRLDQLAAEGLRFTQAYSAAAVCAPSRCSLLTGLHAGHAAVRENPFGGPQSALGDADTTFAEVLRERGYRTGIIGKWGFGPDEPDQPSHPNARGFDEFFGYIGHRHAHDYFPDYLWHNATRLPLPEGGYAIDLFERRALAFLRERARGARARPFLLYLSPNAPHAPSRIPGTDPATLAYTGRRAWNPADRGHAAQVTRLDRLVGAVVDELRRLGLARETLVLVTSDNGPHEEGGTNPDLFDANGPLRGYKRNLYEGGIRVPLIAWRPGAIAPGTVSDRVTPLTDVMPTLAALAGASAPGPLDGVSAAPLLAGEGDGAADEHDDHLYWYRNDPGRTPRANAEEGGRIDRLAEALRLGDWKAIRYAPGRDRSARDELWDFELYDLAADPGETTNLATARPDLVTELTALLRASWTPAGGLN
ncbi:arylsulfatase [Streptomyces sp. 6N223]|uniref:arylsulfatase n=1 Tax=Streptomyces sp. 6N223 TaxID=3457412 RepID=UPI003FCFE02C